MQNPVHATRRAIARPTVLVARPRTATERLLERVEPGAGRALRLGVPHAAITRARPVGRLVYEAS